MPWVDEGKCIGCGLCVQECSVNAISLINGKAVIDMSKCIRCGKCHNVCPQGAVRHDSERNPLIVKENIKEVNELMSNFDDKKEKSEFLNRMIKHYVNKKRIAELTINKIKNMEDY